MRMLGRLLGVCYLSGSCVLVRYCFRGQYRTRFQARLAPCSGGVVVHDVWGMPRDERVTVDLSKESVVDSPIFAGLSDFEGNCPLLGRGRDTRSLTPYFALRIFTQGKRK